MGHPGKTTGSKYRDLISTDDIPKNDGSTADTGPVYGYPPLYFNFDVAGAMQRYLAREALDWSHPTQVKTVRSVGVVVYYTTGFGQWETWFDLRLTSLIDFSVVDETEKYINNAHRKAQMVIRTGLSTQEIVDDNPHLLLPGDFPYCGGIIYRNLIVAVSGFSQEHDHVRALELAEVIRNLMTGAVNDWRINPANDEHWLGEGLDLSVNLH